jgi:hypothetical protein
MSFYPTKNQVDAIHNLIQKVSEMELELSSIRTLLTKYENTKCPDKGDAIICDVMDKFGDLEAHADQAASWAGVIL